MGAILVFDLGDENTLNNVQHWVRQIKNHAGDTIPKILLGNKCDLEIRVTQAAIEEVCKEFGMVYFETSAKINRNIAESFLYIAKEIVNYAKNNENLDLGNGNTNGKSQKEEYKNAPKMGHKINGVNENNDFSGNCKC